MYLLNVKKSDLVKRVFDFVLAFVLLALLWPVFMLVALLVRLFMGSPVFFKQMRPGKNGMLFCMVKFRTMKVLQAHQNMLATDEVRLSRMGAWLRKSSLDELPELWNILRGEMSFVGPRPLLKEYLERYSPRQNRRHEVLPGLTGFAQVNGRNLVDWETRLEMDVWYVENRSFWLDVKILFKTIAVLFSAKGVQGQGSVTMSEFKGST